VKTLLLTEIFPPRTGGSGRWFWEIYRRMPREQVLVCCGEHPQQEAFDCGHDLHVVRLPLHMPAWGIRSVAGLRGYMRLLRQVRRLVRRHGVERIHCARMLPEGWVAWLMKRLFGVPYTVYVHGEETSYGVLSRELGWMMRRVLAGASRVIANSRNTASILQRHWSVAPGSIHILHPGVDTQRFVPAQPDAQVRRGLGWEDRTVVLTVGRLQKRKGYDQMIRALPELSQAVPAVLYTIVGEGEERPGLEQLAARCGVADRVQFFGEVDEARLIECYQQCDLFVLPNREIDGDIEGFGMVLLEAQACGTPVVAGDSGGTAETMRVPETGCVIDCTAPDELVRTLAAWLPDQGLLAEKGRAARVWVEANFAWPALSRQAAKLFGFVGNLEESDRSGEPVEKNVGRSAATENLAGKS